MLKIVADVNIVGQVKDLVGVLKHSEWQEIFELLDVLVLTFADLGLLSNANDRVVWNSVQDHQAILITDNRNCEGADSLQATIESSNTLDSLPVITISNSQRLHLDRAYAKRCATKLIDYLINLEDFRGTGRLYIP